jgi:predicted CoA-binding protein
MQQKKTLVIGASENPERYSNKAIHMLRKHEHEVVAIGNRSGQVENVTFSKDKTAFEDINTVTLYINPQRQPEYYDYILSLKPERIIFNPGTENPELEEMAEANGIQPVEACTLVLLTTGQY